MQEQLWDLLLSKRTVLILDQLGFITVAEEAQGRGFGLKLAAYAVKTLLKDWGCAGVEGRNSKK